MKESNSEKRRLAVIVIAIMTLTVYFSGFVIGNADEIPEVQAEVVDDAGIDERVYISIEDIVGETEIVADDGSKGEELIEEINDESTNLLDKESPGEEDFLSETQEDETAKDVTAHLDAEDDNENEAFYAPLDDLVAEELTDETNVNLTGEHSPRQMGKDLDSDVPSTHSNTTTNKEQETKEQKSSRGDVYLEIERITEDASEKEHIEIKEDSVQENLVYLPIETILEEGVEENLGEEEKTLSYVLYKDTQKELETEATKEELEIVNSLVKEERVTEEKEHWEKEVVVTSPDNVHFSRPVIVYSTIEVVKETSIISVYWEEEKKTISFKQFDENQDGLTDRISWEIPHLSTQTFLIHVDDEDSIKLVSNADSELVLRVIDSPPEEIFTQSNLEFTFDVAYTNLSVVLCNFIVHDQTGTKVIEKNNLTLWNLTLNPLPNDSYNWSMHCYDQGNSSISQNEYGSFSIQTTAQEITFSPSINLSAQSTSVQEGEEVTFTLEIDAEEEDGNYILYFGDDSDVRGSFTKSTHLHQTHSYTTPGDYTATLNVSINGEIYPSNTSLVIRVSETPENLEDSEVPAIDLILPDDDDVLSESTIEFLFNVSDNHNVANCTFNLYYYNTSIVGSLIYSELVVVSTNHSALRLVRHDLTDEGDYSWDVECYDNSTNYRERGRDFALQFADNSNTNEKVSSSKTITRHQEEGDDETFEHEEIQSLIDSINNFFVLEQKIGVEEQNAIEAIGLSDKLKFYKKKLIQMELDLGHNLDFIIDEKRREDRRSEILQEIEDIKQQIPSSISVSENKEFYKNSLDYDVDEVLEAYIEAKGLVLDRSSIGVMKRTNEEIQNYITTSVNGKHVEMDINNTTRQITLITKEITFKNKSFTSFMEVIPKDVVADANLVTFYTEAVVIKADPIFEIAQDSLENNKIVYSINGFIDLALLETTTTLPFTDIIPQSNLGAISGFVTLIGGEGERGIWFYFSWLLFVGIFVAIGVISARKIKVSRWRQNPSASHLYELLTDSEKALTTKEVERAKNNYGLIQQLYPTIPDNMKPLMYKRIRRLQLSLDKKDIAQLIKEFSLAVGERRNEDAMVVYHNIQNLYPRMPKSYKRKVCEKVLPQVKKLQGQGSVKKLHYPS